MRITRNHVLTMASAALFYGPLAAQESTEGPSSPSISQTELKPGDVRASHLLGAMVKRTTGDSIGEIEDLIVSTDADVRLAVISVGGVLGLGEKTIAVPFDQFTVAPDGSTVYLTISEEELSARPAFDLEQDNAAPHSAPDQLGAPAQEPNESAAVPVDPPTRHQDFAAEQQQTAHDAGPDGSFGASKSKATRQPARALVGAEVVDNQNRSVGRINDLVVSAEPPEVQVILELGGESEVSSRFVAVPLAELTIPRGHGDPHRQIESVETTLALNQLEGLPTFEY